MNEWNGCWWCLGNVRWSRLERFGHQIDGFIHRGWTHFPLGLTHIHWEFTLKRILESSSSSVGTLPTFALQSRSLVLLLLLLLLCYSGGLGAHELYSRICQVDVVVAWLVGFGLLASRISCSQQCYIHSSFCGVERSAKRIKESGTTTSEWNCSSRVQVLACHSPYDMRIIQSLTVTAKRVQLAQ